MKKSPKKIIIFSKEGLSFELFLPKDFGFLVLVEIEPVVLEKIF